MRDTAEYSTDLSQSTPGGSSVQSTVTAAWIQYKLESGHNVLCSSSMAFSREFLIAQSPSGHSPPRFDAPPDEDFRMWLDVVQNLKLKVCSNTWSNVGY